MTTDPIILSGVDIEAAVKDLRKPANADHLRTLRLLSDSDKVHEMKRNPVWLLNRGLAQPNYLNGNNAFTITHLGRCTLTLLDGAP